MFLHIVSRHAQYAIRSRTGHSLFVTTDYGHQERVFFQKSRTFGLGQTFWSEIFRGIWGHISRSMPEQTCHSRPISTFEMTRKKIGDCA